MATLKDIKRQIAELERKAEIIKKSELAKVISGIKQKIAEFDLTVEDLFGGQRQGKAAGTKTRARKASVPKYQDPESGAIWTGMGRAPGWMLDAIKKGKKDDFLIGAGAAKAKPAAEKSVKKAAMAAASSKATATKTGTAKAVAKKTATKPVAKIAAPKRATKTKAPAAKKGKAPVATTSDVVSATDVPIAKIAIDETSTA